MIKIQWLTITHECINASFLSTAVNSISIINFNNHAQTKNHNVIITRYFKVEKDTIKREIFVGRFALYRKTYM